MDLSNYERLEVWKDSMDLVIEIYRITDSFPKTEKYGLVDQIRRAAVSIPANISEGSGRNTIKELIQFLFISKGSMNELNTLLQISLNLNLLSKENYTIYRAKILSLTKRTNNLISSKRNQL